MSDTRDAKMIKRLNTTLPDPLAAYVGAVTGKGTLYETPSEFIRDLVRRHMETTLNQERADIHNLLAHSLSEQDYADWTDDDLADARKVAEA